MSCLKPNSSYRHCIARLLRNRIIVRNRCTLCCLTSRSAYDIDHPYRDNLGSLTRLDSNLGLSSIRLFSLNEKQWSDKAPEHTEEKPHKKSIFKRFKEMYRDYWYVLIPVHLATSAVWVSGFYYLATSGVDIPSLLEAMNCSEKIVNSMRNSSMGYWAITYGLYKIATPARYAVTLGGTTVSIQYLKNWGYIKPTAELKEMYREKKQNIIDQKDNIMDKVSDLRDKKEKFMERVRVTQKDMKGKKDSLLGKETSTLEKEKKVESNKNDKS